MISFENHLLMRSTLAMIRVWGAWGDRLGRAHDDFGVRGDLGAGPALDVLVL
jgi:hypothetical protein